MQKDNLTRRNIDALEDVFKVASDALQEGARTNSIVYAVTARSIYSGMKEILYNITRYEKFDGWDRQSNDSKLLDRYILQYIIGLEASESLIMYLYRRKPVSMKKPNVDSDRLIREISEGASYLRIEQASKALAGNGEYKQLIKVLEHIRRNFKKPKPKQQ